MNNAPEIFVDHIWEENNVIHGAASQLRTVKTNLPILFSSIEMNQLSEECKKHGSTSGFSIAKRFFQFVIVCDYIPSIEDINIRFFDFTNSTDAFLDELGSLNEKGWSKEEREHITSLYLESQENQSTLAKMILVSYD